MLFLRNDVEATILRLPGQTFQTTETSVRNIYTVKLINKTTEDISDVSIKLISHKGNIEMVGGYLNVKRQGLKEGSLFIEIEKKNLKSSVEDLKIGIYANGKLIETTSTNFTGPLIIK